MSELLLEGSTVAADAADPGSRRKNRRRLGGKLIVGSILVGVILLFGLIAPFFTLDPRAVSNIGLAPPSAEHWLGTTQTGQDVLSQLAYGTRGSLLVGILVGIGTLVLSAFFGILGSYVGGFLDEAFSLISNVVLIIPGLPLMIVIGSYVQHKSVFLVALVLTLTGWAAGSRVLRGQTLSLRNRDYVLAARVSGEKAWRVVCVEILPNLLPVMSSGFVFSIVFAILGEAGLSFIGVGSTGSLTWGTMLANAQNGQALLLGGWWWFVPPGLLIAVFGCGLSLVNFSIDEVINPRLRTPRLKKLQDRLMTGTDILTVSNLRVDYVGEETVHAVDDVSLSVRRGEILGLAGESGCGKSTLAYGINQLLKPPALVTGGEVVFHDSSGADIDVLRLEDQALRRYRWDKVSMVFQGSMNALNPVIPIEAQIADVFTTHRPDMSKVERHARAAELLRLVSVDPNRLGSYAHELSGGMRQRVMIAMALALGPQLMIMDEPTTALDVVVQREIIGEIMRLRSELGFAVIFITHDLPLLLEISDRIAIMRSGKILETGTAEDIFFAAQDPYTRKLLNSFPSLTGERGDFIRTGVALEEPVI